MKKRMIIKELLFTLTILGLLFVVAVSASPGPSTDITPDKLWVYDILAGSTNNKAGPCYVENTGTESQDNLYDFTVSLAIRISDDAYIEFTKADIYISSGGQVEGLIPNDDPDNSYPQIISEGGKIWTFISGLTLPAGETATIYFYFNCEGIPEGFDLEKNPEGYDVEVWVFMRSTEGTVSSNWPTPVGWSTGKINWYHLEPPTVETAGDYPLHSSIDPYDPSLLQAHIWEQHSWTEKTYTSGHSGMIDVFQVPELPLGTLLGLVAPIIALAIKHTKK